MIFYVHEKLKRMVKFSKNKFKEIFGVKQKASDQVSVSDSEKGDAVNDTESTSDQRLLDKIEDLRELTQEVKNTATY